MQTWQSGVVKRINTVRRETSTTSTEKRNQLCFYKQPHFIRFIRYFTLFLIGIGVISVLVYLVTCLLYERVPLTKWCGKGGIASSAKDYGIASAVDKCCQDHDYCPMSINSNETKYSITNPSRYTLSDCRCDSRFHQCLHRVISDSTMLDKTMALIVGLSYFDLIRVSCVQFHQDFSAAKIIGKVESARTFFFTLNLLTQGSG